MDNAGERAAKKLEIKKYPNRRYYDATHSQHLTLEQICAYIQRGYDISVTDARTGADITAQVLTQIILELETTKLDSLPVPLLVRLIRTNDQLVKDFIEKYFNQALGSFLDYQAHFEEQVRRTHGLPASFPSVTAWTKAMLGPFASAFGGGNTSAAAPEASRPAAAEPDNRELREMIARLEKQVAALQKPANRQKTAARRSRRSS